MIINDAFFQLEDQNQLLIQEILASQSYKNYLLKRTEMNTSPEVAKLKKAFQKRKINSNKLQAMVSMHMTTANCSEAFD